MTDHHQRMFMKSIVLVTALAALGLVFVLSGPARTLAASVAMFSAVFYARAFLAPVPIRRDRE